MNIGNRSISHLHEITVTFDNSSEKRLKKKRPTYLAENHDGYSGLKGNTNNSFLREKLSDRIIFVVVFVQL